MKVLSPTITAVFLVFIFVLGFANMADAAYAGKKKQATESVISNSSETTVTTPVPSPVTPPAADVSTILLVILSFILPPLAVYLLFEEVNNAFWLNVVLTLLFWIPGVIYALYLVLTH